MKQTDHQIQSTCTACNKKFRTTAEFARHRTGQHGKNRRCLTTDEMHSDGWIQTNALWRSPHAQKTNSRRSNISFPTPAQPSNTHENKKQLPQ